MTLRGIKNRVLRLLGRDASRRWNREHANGQWKWLNQLDELAHYSVIAGYVSELATNLPVLDVGCGDGLLLSRLHRSFSSYVGVDFEEAVQQASARATPNARFVVADMHDFTTDERFGAIVFNETLYYSATPHRLLDRYAAMLLQDGVLIISMHGARTSSIHWDAVAERCTLLDEVVVTNGKGTQWQVRAVRPKELGG